jgi:hypothetical protein
MKLEPAVRGDTLTTQRRFRVEGTGAAGPVLEGPEGPHVLVAGDDQRTLTRRPVTIGSILYEYECATVEEGLHENEYIGSALTFFLDAERGLQERVAA